MSSVISGGRVEVDFGRLSGSRCAAVMLVGVEVVPVPGREVVVIPEDEQVFGVLVFGLAREVETARDHRP